MTESANLRARLSQGPRRKAREFALLGVYESLINETADFAAIDANLLSVISDEGGAVAGCDLTSDDFVHCDQQFYRDILDGVMKGKTELLEIIGRHLDRDPQRLSVVERACLMIGTWEMINCPQIPYRVVINEAVELCKVFGADRGYKLVNGVLDKIASELRPSEHKA